MVFIFVLFALLIGFFIWKYEVIFIERGVIIQARDLWRHPDEEPAVRARDKLGL